MLSQGGDTPSLLSIAMEANFMLYHGTAINVFSQALSLKRTRGSYKSTALPEQAGYQTPAALLRYQVSEFAAGALVLVCSAEL